MWPGDNFEQDPQGAIEKMKLRLALSATALEFTGILLGIGMEVNNTSSPGIVIAAGSAALMGCTGKYAADKFRQIKNDQ
jgi:hypothetical protein